MENSYDIAIIGGGILGLATARGLGERIPRARLVVLEKEAKLATHQTGNNSGVIHSGIYYKPGSYKAKLCVEGKGLMLDFCQKHGIRVDHVGKVIVATETGAGVTSIRRRAGAIELVTPRAVVRATRIVNCAGLYSDLVARMAGAKVDVRIIPFRGEYYMIRPERQDIVRGLIYPVPDPEFPFL